MKLSIQLSLYDSNKKNRFFSSVLLSDDKDQHPINWKENTIISGQNRFVEIKIVYFYQFSNIDKIVVKPLINTIRVLTPNEDIFNEFDKQVEQETR
jgi:hypothetical protein